MKSLKTIQVFARIGRIISKIIFIFCIIGFCGCILGIVGLGADAAVVKIGGKSLKTLIAKYAEMSIPALWAAMAKGALVCAVEAVLSKFAEVYCRHELADGTPFTRQGANELLRLGILVIAVPSVASIIFSIGVGAAGALYPELQKLPDGDFGSFGLGLMMIVTSFICRYGTDLREGKTVEEHRLPE